MLTNSFSLPPEIRSKKGGSLSGNEKPPPTETYFGDARHERSNQRTDRDATAADCVTFARKKVRTEDHRSEEEEEEGKDSIFPLSSPPLP